MKKCAVVELLYTRQFIYFFKLWCISISFGITYSISIYGPDLLWAIVLGILIFFPGSSVWFSDVCVICRLDSERLKTWLAAYRVANLDFEDPFWLSGNDFHRHAAICFSLWKIEIPGKEMLRLYFAKSCVLLKMYKQ